MTGPPAVDDVVALFRGLSIPGQSAFLDAALTDEQAEALHLRRRERREHPGLSWADEHRRLAEQADPATITAFETMPRALAERMLAYWDAVGIDDDLRGSSIVRQLCAAGGVPTVEVEALASELTGWQARTDEGRWAAVAKDLLDDGVTDQQVRAAIAELVDEAGDAP